MVLSMGPQHPSTHGVLQIMLEIEGETSSRPSPRSATCTPASRSRPKISSGRKRRPSSSAWTILRPSSNCALLRAWPSRSCSASPTAFPSARKHHSRAHAELTRIASHCVWLGTHGIDLGAISVFFYCFDLRENILDLQRSRGRRAHASELPARRRPQRRSARRLSRRRRRA